MKILKNRIFLAVCCMAAAVGFMLIYASSFTASQKTIVAYKANLEISKGMMITESMLSPVEVTPLSGIVTNKEEIIGENAAADLAAGQIIFAGNLGANTGSENLEQLLDGSRVAYSLSIGSLAAGVSGSLVANDIVSVYTSTDGVSKLPPELTYVPVLFASIADGEDQAKSEESKTATVTLLVTPAQALILNKHEYTSDSHLALVYRGAPEIAAQFVATQKKTLDTLAKTPREEKGGAADGE